MGLPVTDRARLLLLVVVLLQHSGSCCVELTLHSSRA
jgi:hypothetical protein